MAFRYPNCMFNCGDPETTIQLCAVECLVEWNLISYYKKQLRWSFVNDI